ncbi:hypothetical protein L218DRAFT_952626 [Marasmius fiardii PR-910]|nr:hypothetical protein L218DRAFT_952626 [Marasmius fiardii PR-910]
MVCNETWLRGGFPTNREGITLYLPSHSYHLNWTKSANGTFASHSENLIHIGQFFFEEDWNDKVYATSPYNESAGNN